jgi:transcriptional regulator with XRE-family HTH domain
MSDSIRQKLSALASGRQSGWLEDAKSRKENQAWLRRSQQIALKILRTLRARKLTQTELATVLGVSPQQISKIVKGQENLTLETVSRLETALGITLLQVPEYAITTQLERNLPDHGEATYLMASTPAFINTCAKPYGQREIGLDAHGDHIINAA